MSVAVMEKENPDQVADNPALIVEHSDILRALNHCQGIVERRNTIPILGNVLLDAQDNTLSLRATDLDMAFAESINAQVQQAGRITVPVHTFHDIVRKFPSGSQLEISVEKGQMLIKCGRSRFRLPTLPAEDFPDFGESVETSPFNITIHGLKQLIDRTKAAMSMEETRYFLNGIYLHRMDGMLRAVATDGHRLARADLPADGLPAEMPGIIIPRKTINEIRKLLDDVKDEHLTISLTDTRINFKVGHFSLTSKLIDGKFPEYERIIPANNTLHVIVNVGVLAQATDRVATISAEKTRSVKCLIENNKITLNASGIDAGQAKEEIEAEYEQDSIDLGFNARYLLDILSQIDDDQCRISIKDTSTPVVIQGEHTEEDLFVLMPMRV